MVKIAPIPLSQINPKTKGLIQNFNFSQKNFQSDKITSKLNSMGVISGREIFVIKKSFGSVLAKVENDNPLAIRNSIAKAIMVKPLEESPSNSVKSKNKFSFFDYILKLFKS